MQFSDLITYVRDLTDDPSGTPIETFSDAKIKRFLNIRYLAIRERAGLVGESAGRKITYLTPSAGDPVIAKPGDYVQALSVQIELDGGDLSALDPDEANIRLLKPRAFEPAQQDWQIGGVTEVRFYSVQDANLYLTAPPETVGTDSVRLVYRASSIELVDDADEPVIPRPYHDVIGLQAAVDLLGTKDQENRTLVFRSQVRTQQFEQGITDELWDPDYQAPVAGLDDQEDNRGRHGWIE